jgi:molybdopterin synthase catalytic subunit
MKRRIELTEEPLDIAHWIGEWAMDGRHGAVVTFVGVVRETEGEATIAGLEYTAFEEMARHQLEGLVDELATRWPVGHLHFVHRLGRVPVGEASLWIALSTPHRAEAFEACQWLIVELKRVVPIWKRSY